MDWDQVVDVVRHESPVVDNLDTMAERREQVEFDGLDTVEGSHCPLGPCDHLLDRYQNPYELEDP